MSIAFDSKSNSSGSGTSLTFSHVCSGSNLILIVGIQTYLVSPTGITISSVTYDGVEMTSFGNVERTPNGEYQYMYYLIAPSVGSQNIIITTTTPMDYIGATSASYTGVRQTGQPDSYVTFPNSTGTSITTTTTTIADNSWLVGFYVVDTAGTWTAGLDTTARDAIGNARLFDSNGAKTPAGSYSLIATHPIGVLSGQMVSISPYILTNPGMLIDFM